LDFRVAEGTHAERRQRLGLALISVGCDAELSRLCEYVFNVTSGGVNGALTKTYAELSARPWNMCCSKSKARATVDLAVELGLLSKAEDRYTARGQKANSYAINWEGIARILNGRPGVVAEHPPASGKQPPALPEHPPASGKHPYKEYTNSFNHLSKAPFQTRAAEDCQSIGTPARRRSFDVADVETLTWPAALDSDEGRAALTEWLTYKRERGDGYKSSRGPQAVLDDFAAFGIEALKTAIANSIRNNWRGVFPPRSAAQHQAAHMGPGQVYRE
jgi:hypothetical protein